MAAVWGKSPVPTCTWYFIDFIFLDSEVVFFPFFRELEAFCAVFCLGFFFVPVRAVQNKLPGGIGSSKVNVCQGYSVTGLSVPLLKVFVN